MVQRTKIEWATHTSNPIKFRDKVTGKSVWGCIRKSPGCAHCYSADLAKRYGRGGAFTAEEMAGYECYVDEAELKALLSVKRLPTGSMCFLGDMTDVFGEWVPFEMLDRVFAVMALRPDVVFQVLTKRPERMREYMTLSATPAHIAFAVSRVERPGIREGLPWRSNFETGQIEFPWWPLPNVWLGTSVENQHWADERVPELLATPASVRFLSCEPLLGPVEFSDVSKRSDCVSQLGEPALNGIGWVICGGESGKNARPMHPQWALSMRDQCKAAGVPFHFKQWGETDAEGNRVGKKQAGRLLDGQEWNELPTEWHLQQMADDAQRLDMGY